MTLVLWIVVFITALIVLIKSADWFTESSEQIGLVLGLSPFVIGIIIVALGTSLPELVTGLIAVFRNTSEIVSANVIGSNIANILLVLGIASIVAGRLEVKRSLIKLDLPLLLGTTVLFLMVAWDKVITWPEGILLLVAFVVYLAYSSFYHEEKETADEVKEITKVLPETQPKIKISNRRPKLKAKETLLWIIGAIGICLGAKYVVDSTIKIGAMLKISISILSMIAIAIGTSLPELAVSIQAARKKKYAIAFGNVLGSNIFNALVVIGLPSLFKNLIVDQSTWQIGLPIMVAATLLFVFSGISKRIYKWEGMIYILIYFLFVIKLFNLF
ncbi:MAG: calcium/sodium antiporter [Candidatus Aenigmarchaeota archaeon]|nr:calcium/sodium antiporter [Candidatus Aenigmarchaeota archaeon]